MLKDQSSTGRLGFSSGDRRERYRHVDVSRRMVCTVEGLIYYIFDDPGYRNFCLYVSSLFVPSWAIDSSTSG